MYCFETKSSVRLFPNDLLPGEAEIVDIESLFKLGCWYRMTPGFAFKPFPDSTKRIAPN